MGTDKALLVVDGAAMAVRVATALHDGGADEVFCVGGDRSGLAALGLDCVPDEHPGGGPLRGMLTALREAGRRGAATLVVSACDHPDLDRGTVAALRAALDAARPDAVWAGPVDVDGSEPLVVVLAVEPGIGAVEALVAAGATSVRALRDGVAGVRVPGLPARPLHDVDHPGDLHKR